MTGPAYDLPRYKCYKIVRALKIGALEVHEDKSVTIVPQNPHFAPFRTRSGYWTQTSDVNDPGYYVMYADGYVSWSPTEAFEDGYTLIEGV